MQNNPTPDQTSANSSLKFKKQGTSMPVLSIYLQPDQEIYCQSGSMRWMTPNIKMQTHMHGLLKGLGRKITRESIFQNYFTAPDGEGVVSFTSHFTGDLINTELTPEKPGIIVQKGGFLCAEQSVDSKVKLYGLIRGFLGGDGFLFRHYTGRGNLFFEIDGSIKKYTLQSGEVIRVDQGYVAAFSDTVQYKIGRIKGIFNWIFGGEGIFICTLTGPGEVWVQTLPRKVFVRTYGIRSAKHSFAGCLGCVFYLFILLVFLFLLIGIPLIFIFAS